MIELINVTQHYGVRPVLKRINLRIEAGELVVIVGPNGMGKSTLLGVIGGALQPQHGKVIIDGNQRRHSVEDELAIRRRAVYLPDQPWLPPQRTGREFLLSVGNLYDIDMDRLMEHVDRLLELFELSSQGDWNIGRYSAGQQKKIALSSALVTEAPILLLDEPFSGGLDPSGLLALKRVLKRRVADQGGTVVLTSPVPEIVEEIADRIVVLKAGEIAAFDTLDGLRRLTNCSGSLAEIFERLMFPKRRENWKTTQRDAIMNRWLRVVMPPWWAVFAGAFYLGLEAIVLAIEWRLGIPFYSSVDGKIFVILMASFAVAYAVYRVRAFHPALRPKYCGWLSHTPWTSQKPLPLGPVHLTLQDMLLLSAAVGLCWPRAGIES